MEPATWMRTRTYRSRWPRAPGLAGLARGHSPPVLGLTGHSLMQLVSSPWERPYQRPVYIYRYIFICMPGAITQYRPKACSGLPHPPGLSWRGDGVSREGRWVPSPSCL